VSFSGIIGFVGLIVPHLVRLLWGHDYRRLLPLSILGGASSLLLADLLARLVMAPQELPVGIITALAGGPFFLWVLWRSQKMGQGMSDPENPRTPACRVGIMTWLPVTPGAHRWYRQRCTRPSAAHQPESADVT
jgi:hypothetical protein